MLFSNFSKTIEKSYPAFMKKPPNKKKGKISAGARIRAIVTDVAKHDKK